MRTPTTPRPSTCATGQPEGDRLRPVALTSEIAQVMCVLARAYEDPTRSAGRAKNGRWVWCWCWQKFGVCIYWFWWIDRPFICVLDFLAPRRLIGIQFSVRSFVSLTVGLCTAISIGQYRTLGAIEYADAWGRIGDSQA